MSTLKNTTFAINGVIDTNKPVLQNMNTLANASGCWVTFDINQGKWAVIINQPGTSVKSFTDNNIIGNITVSGTGITELYNSVQVDYPHKDLLDQKDTIYYSINESNRFPNEQDNTLNFQLDCVNDPVQIEMLAVRELKQSRVDKIIKFRTDFTSLGLKAGDIIDITADMYGFTSKKFRILTISEEDGDDNTIQLAITAFEYDESVYNTNDVVREDRSTTNGVQSKIGNASLTNNDNQSTTTSVSNSLLNPANLALLLSLMNALTRNGNSSGIDGAIGLTPLVYAFVTSFQQITNYTATATDVNLGYSKTVPLSGIYKIKYNINWGGGSLGSSETGVYKTSQISYSINGSPVIGIDESATGDGHVQVYEDHIIEGVLGLTAGQTITFYFTYATNWPTAVFLVNAELILLQRI